jgi:hypothetical protein
VCACSEKGKAEVAEDQAEERALNKDLATRRLLCVWRSVRVREKGKPAEVEEQEKKAGKRKNEGVQQKKEP